jgi:hypothetical protein
MLEPIITATIVAFVELTLHWFPWDLMLRRKLPRLAAYVLGVLGMMLPFTVLLIYWRESQVLIALWLVIGSGGLAVTGAWLGDEFMRRLAHAAELEELNETRQASNSTHTQARSS